jgi:hypothetical protein
MSNSSSPYKYVQTPERKLMHRTRGISLAEKKALPDQTRQRDKVYYPTVIFLRVPSIKYQKEIGTLSQSQGMDNKLKLGDQLKNFRTI